ncbi:hypothetical protein, partial [Aeromicrobium sp.]|uniref:hypothetical protein n=1 Tax=Aeromicrobium sp. TaxID=1871063 RepID=UPI003C31F3AE
MNRVTTLALAVVGPLCVAFLRFVLPYYTASDSTAAARAVGEHLGRESAVLWLGLAASLTLAPGLYAVRDALPTSQLARWGFSLTVIGYLSLPIVLVGDMALWAGTKQGLGPVATGRLLDNVHPAYDVGLGVFVAAHVIGTVLL